MELLGNWPYFLGMSKETCLEVLEYVFEATIDPFQICGSYSELSGQTFERDVLIKMSPTSFTWNMRFICIGFHFSTSI